MKQGQVLWTPNSVSVGGARAQAESNVGEAQASGGALRAGRTPWAQGPGKQRFGNVRTECRECALVGNEEQLDRSWEVCVFSINVIWLMSQENHSEDFERFRPRTEGLRPAH